MSFVTKLFNKPKPQPVASRPAPTPQPAQSTGEATDTQRPVPRRRSGTPTRFGGVLNPEETALAVKKRLLGE